MEAQKSYTVRTDTGEIQLMSQDQVTKMVRSSIERAKSQSSSPPKRHGCAASPEKEVYSASTATSRRLSLSPRSAVPKPLSPRSRFSLSTSQNKAALTKDDSTAKLFKNFQEAINTGGSSISENTQKISNIPSPRRTTRESREDRNTSNSLRGETIDERFATLISSPSPMVPAQSLSSGDAASTRSYTVSTEKDGKKSMSETEINDLVRNSIKRARKNAKKRSSSDPPDTSHSTSTEKTVQSTNKLHRKFSWSSVEDSGDEEAREKPTKHNEQLHILKDESLSTQKAEIGNDASHEVKAKETIDIELEEKKRKSKRKKHRKKGRKSSRKKGSRIEENDRNDTKETPTKKESDAYTGTLKNPFNVFGAFFPRSTRSPTKVASIGEATTNSQEDEEQNFDGASGTSQNDICDSTHSKESLHHLNVSNESASLEKRESSHEENQPAPVVEKSNSPVQTPEKTSVTFVDFRSLPDSPRKARSDALSIGGESAMSDIEICRMVQQSMDRAKVASQEITEMLRESPDKRQPIAEVAGIVKKTMRRARESALGIESPATVTSDPQNEPGTTAQALISNDENATFFQRGHLVDGKTNLGVKNESDALKSHANAADDDFQARDDGIEVSASSQSSSIESSSFDDVQKSGSSEEDDAAMQELIVLKSCSSSGQEHNSSAAASLRNELSKRLSQSVSPSGQQQRGARLGKYSKQTRTTSARRARRMRRRSKSASASTSDDEADAVVSGDMVEQIAAKKATKISLDEPATIRKSTSPKKEDHKVPLLKNNQSLLVSSQEDEQFLSASQSMYSSKSLDNSGSRSRSRSVARANSSSQESVGADVQFCMDIADFFKQLDLMDAIRDVESYDDEEDDGDDFSVNETWTAVESTTYSATFEETAEYETDAIVDEDESRRVTFSFSPRRRESYDYSSDESSGKLW